MGGEQSPTKQSQPPKAVVKPIQQEKKKLPTKNLLVIDGSRNNNYKELFQDKVVNEYALNVTVAGWEALHSVVYYEMESTKIGDMLIDIETKQGCAVLKPDYILIRNEVKQAHPSNVR